MSDSRPPAPLSTTRTTMQFSMRTLMIVVTVVAVASALLSYFGDFIVIFVFAVVTMLVVPVCLGTLALYCRGPRQTFFIGALAGALAPHVLGDMDSASDIGELIVVCMIQLIASGSCGYAAVATRRFLERRGWHLPPDRDDSPPGD